MLAVVHGILAQFESANHRHFAPPRLAQENLQNRLLSKDRKLEPSAGFRFWVSVRVRPQKQPEIHAVQERYNFFSTDRPESDPAPQYPPAGEGQTHHRIPSSFAGCLPFNAHAACRSGSPVVSACRAEKRRVLIPLSLIATAGSEQQ